MVREPLTELVQNITQSGQKGMMDRQGAGIGRWKRLARNVNGKENQLSVNGLGNKCQVEQREEHSKQNLRLILIGKHVLEKESKALSV